MVTLGEPVNWWTSQCLCGWTGERVIVWVVNFWTLILTNILNIEAIVYCQKTRVETREYKVDGGHKRRCRILVMNSLGVSPERSLAKSSHSCYVQYTRIDIPELTYQNWHTRIDIPELTYQNWHTRIDIPESQSQIFEWGYRMSMKQLMQTKMF